MIAARIAPIAQSVLRNARGSFLVADEERRTGFRWDLQQYEGCVVDKYFYSGHKLSSYRNIHLSETLPLAVSALLLIRTLQSVGTCLQCFLDQTLIWDWLALPVNMDARDMSARNNGEVG
jgi:hypothetical protein